MRLEEAYPPGGDKPGTPCRGAADWKNFPELVLAGVKAANWVHTARSPNPSVDLLVPAECGGSMPRNASFSSSCAHCLPRSRQHPYACLPLPASLQELPPRPGTSWLSSSNTQHITGFCWNLLPGLQRPRHSTAHIQTLLGRRLRPCVIKRPMCCRAVPGFESQVCF